MPQENVTVVPSVPLVRALSQSSVATTPLLPQQPALGDPGANTAGARSAGFWEMGQGGMYSPQGLFLVPFGSGNKGDQFLMRLWGWRKQLGFFDAETLWVPLLLAELACTLADVPGVATPPSELVLTNEKFCDTIGVTRGQAGVANPSPGGDLIAYASVGLAGCQRVQFEFERVDSVTMNCLWARV